MMPKGVEHSQNINDAIAEGFVRIPMMPKGVEHAFTSVLVPPAVAGENSDDAERR